VSFGAKVNKSARLLADVDFGKAPTQTENIGVRSEQTKAKKDVFK
jgi:hypothetical protein